MLVDTPIIYFIPSIGTSVPTLRTAMYHKLETIENNLTNILKITKKLKFCIKIFVQSKSSHLNSDIQLTR